MKIRNLIFSFVVSYIFVALTVSAIAQDNDDTTIDFKNDIAPILESNCMSCHGPEEPDGGYRIDNADDAMDYIDAGESENSELYQYLISEEEDEMMPPPDDGGPMDDSDIQMIKTWIDEGATWPDGFELQMPANDEGTEENTPDVKTSEEATTDAAEMPSADKGPNIYKALGSLHPATLHMPMGLLLAAGLFAFLSLRGNFVMSDCAYYCLWLGALTAIIACVTGWWFTLSESPKEYVDSVEDFMNQDHKLYLHRLSAIIVTVLALFLALFAASARNKDPDDGVFWKLGVIVLAMGVGFVGQQGGKLTWKESHYDELWEVIDQFIPGVVGEDELGGAADESSSADEASDEEPGIADVETLP